MTLDSIFLMVLRVGVGLWCLWVVWMLAQVFRRSVDPAKPEADPKTPPGPEDR